MRVLLRLDAGGEIGMGHAVRSTALLQQLPGPIELTVAGNGDGLAHCFNGADVIAVPDRDADAVADIAGRLEPALTLCDHTDPGPGFWTALRERVDAPVVAIDDFGGSIAPDAVINGTVPPDHHAYPDLPRGALKLVGSSYALLRADFAAARWQDPQARSVVIVVGSGRRAAEWALHLVSGALDLDGWGRVRMIVGAAFPAVERLRQSCDRLGVDLEQGVPATELAARLSQATVALVTGGMIVYECLAVGAPMVVYPQEADQIAEITWFARHDCVVDLGHTGGMTEAKVEAAVGTLLDDPDRRRAYSRAGRSIVDGRGVERAAAALVRRFGLAA